MDQTAIGSAEITSDLGGLMDEKTVSACAVVVSAVNSARKRLPRARQKPHFAKPRWLDWEDKPPWSHVLSQRRRQPDDGWVMFVMRDCFDVIWGAICKGGELRATVLESPTAEDCKRVLWREWKDLS